jgi:hypothetical protein
MRLLALLAFASASTLAFQGQTPAPAASAPAPATAPGTAAKPLRQLVFSMSVGEHISHDYHNSGMNGSTGGQSSGVVTDYTSGGRQGSIAVDVLGLNPDGGLIASVLESWQGQTRPEQRFVCVVYGDGRIGCPGGAVRPTDAEELLLSFLGRGFIDPSKMDADKRWSRTDTTGDFTIASNYTMTDNGDGKPVTVEKITKITSRSRTAGDTNIDTVVKYDVAMSVPDSIHSQLVQLNETTVRTTIDLVLTKDSYVTH